MVGAYVGILGVIAGLLLGHSWYALSMHLAASESPRTPRYTGVVVSHSGSSILLKTAHPAEKKTAHVRVETDDSTQWFVVRYTDSDNGVRIKSQSLDIKPPGIIPPGVTAEVSTTLTARGNLKAKDVSFYDPS